MLAVKAFEVAWPLDPVTAVAEVVKVPEAPLAGGVKVTVTPETGLPYWSTSWTTSGLEKAGPPSRSGRCPRRG